MKTTLEIPDDLMRRIKLRAVYCNRRLKDEITQLLEAGIASAAAVDAPRKPPRPIRLRGKRPLTIRDIETAIATGRD